MVKQVFKFEQKVIFSFKFSENSRELRSDFYTPK
jgi:hypothetical protein